MTQDVAAVACIKDQIQPDEMRLCPCNDCYLGREAAAERGGYGTWESHEIGLLSDRQRAKVLNP